MLNALDNLPEDSVELRRVTELLASEVKAQALMIEKLQHLHIPGYPPTYSDNIRPFVPGYPPSFDALP